MTNHIYTRAFVNVFYMYFLAEIRVTCNVTTREMIRLFKYLSARLQMCIQDLQTRLKKMMPTHL